MLGDCSGPYEIGWDIGCCRGGDLFCTCCRAIWNVIGGGCRFLIFSSLVSSVVISSASGVAIL